MAQTDQTRRRTTSRQRTNTVVGQAPQKAAPVAARPNGATVVDKPVAAAFKPQEVPVVDVPVTGGNAQAIEAFCKAHTAWFTTFLKKEWGDEADAEIVGAVVREVAECRTLNRTARASEYWDSDTLEYIIQAWSKANPTPEAPKKRLTPKVAQAAETAPPVPEVKAKAPVAPPAKVEAPKAPVKAQAAEPEKRRGRGANKPKIPVVEKVRNPGGRKPLVAKDVELSEVTEATGNRQWELAIVYLKEKGDFWCQAQDVPSIARHLRAVSEGLETLPEKLTGTGSRTYGRDKLARCLQLLKDLVHHD